MGRDSVSRPFNQSVAVVVSQTESVFVVVVESVVRVSDTDHQTGKTLLQDGLSSGLVCRVQWDSPSMEVVIRRLLLAFVNEMCALYNAIRTEAAIPSIRRIRNHMV